MYEATTRCASRRIRSEVARSSSPHTLAKAKHRYRHPRPFGAAYLPPEFREAVTDAQRRSHADPASNAKA